MLIVIAEKEELKLVEELGLQDKPIIITGVGAINVINELKNIPKNEHIINVGYAGSNNLNIGTRVAVSVVKTLHEKANFTEQSKCCHIQTKNFDVDVDVVAPCYTSTDFVTKTKIKEDCVFDMELAFICSLFDNVWAIKVVSDNLNKKQYKEKIKSDRKS